MILADFVIFFSFVRSPLRHNIIDTNDCYHLSSICLSVCVCLSIVPSIENREWRRRIIVVTEENQGLKGIGLQEMDRVVDPFDRQPTRPSVITLLWYICFSFKLKTKQKQSKERVDLENKPLKFVNLTQSKPSNNHAY